MQDKYFNDALIGNDEVRASFTKTGELTRLFYSSVDYKQFLELFHVGLKVNNSAIIYLHNDINNVYSQKYIDNSNVLLTEIYNKYFNVKISQTDFVPIGEKYVVKDYVIKNENTIDLDISLLVYSKLLTNCNNSTSGFAKNDVLMQYNHDFSVCTFSNRDITSRQINNVSSNFMTGMIGGKDYIGMSPDSAISYNLNKLSPGQEVKITLFVYINKNEDIDMINGIHNEIKKIRNIDVENVKQNTIEYWQNYLKEHDKLKLNDKNINLEIKKIYNRTILLYSLLINKKSGGISAGMEVDENKTKCGRYSYCWTRDAAFITEAFDIIGMEDETERFYSKFCKNTQYENGMWEQRFYTDGRLAPCWGYQIDETASVVFGAYSHYKFCKNKQFLIDNLNMLEKAIQFLKSYINDIFGENRFYKSYDLWEEFEGISLYSIASIFAAFSSMISIYNQLQDYYENDSFKLNDINNKIVELETLKNRVKEYCLNSFYDENKKSYVRNLDDRRIDISILGTIIPFEMFSPYDINVQNTIEKINMILRTYTAGYVRYENDNYIGGKNPWPIATLWMSWYYLSLQNYDEAIKCFDFVVNSSSDLGFLGEQVDNEKMEPCWVIGLTWSHAMFIITLKKFLDMRII